MERLKVNPAQLINQTSNNCEYFTPPHILDAVRACFNGLIDLDPASSTRANAIVKANRFYTKTTNGLLQAWTSTSLWMNHPFGRDTNTLWISKLLHEYQNQSFPQALCITYACTSEKWFQPLLKHPQCFLYPRTNFLLPNGNVLRGVTKGCVITYLGHNIHNFRNAFAKLGTVKI